MVLSGTLQVCLEPANVQTLGQVVACDPQYANFGLININVAGLATFYAYSGNIGARDFEGFYGTSAAAPEPTHLGIVVGAILLLFPLAAPQKRLSLHFMLHNFLFPDGKPRL